MSVHDALPPAVQVAHVRALIERAHLFILAGGVLTFADWRAFTAAEAFAYLAAHRAVAIERELRAQGEHVDTAARGEIVLARAVRSVTDELVRRAA